jgi:hypothetical protein
MVLRVILSFDRPDTWRISTRVMADTVLRELEKA